MAIRKGRCTNFKNCDLADQHRIVDLPDTAEFNCPGCGRPLSGGQIVTQHNWTPVIVVVVGLIAVVFAAMHFLGGGRTKPGTNPATGASGGASGNSGAPNASAWSPILRLHGSNTIGAQLVPALAEAYLKAQGATNVRRAPAGNDELLVQGNLPGSSTSATIEIYAHGSSTAFTDLAEDKCDIGMASRKIASNEIQSLAGLGDMTGFTSEHVLGMDGIAIIVNRGNSVPSLTKAQLAKIFTGEITNWSQVRGSGGSIHVYARDDKSGTYDTFKTLVLESGQLVSTAKRIEDSAALSDAVAGDPEAIGFVGLPYISSAKAVPVGDAGVEPLLPTRMTVATEDYLLSRRLYLYTPANPSKPATRKFVEFALSKAGQDIVGGEGFVSQNVSSARAPVVSTAPQGYKDVIAGAERLSLDFRFKSGATQLDNKAQVDLDRTITFLSDLGYSGDRVMLLGFADSTGTAEANRALSEKRAMVVAEQFAPRGLHPKVVKGFGQEMPVASNNSDDGRQKNRRVEVWVKK
jgi:phosphate transport system substrate-binding protein